jgi:hypothetical protein
MNYHKKLQDLGFKKHTALVIYQFSDYKAKIGGYLIKEASQYFRDKYNESIGEKYNKLRPNTTLILYDMGMSINQDNSKKFQTYRWKISEGFNLYVTIFKDTFCCFGTDEKAIDTNDKWLNVKNNIFLVCNGKLNNDFWKEILNNLPLQYKREIILKDII